SVRTATPGVCGFLTHGYGRVCRTCASADSPKARRKLDHMAATTVTAMLAATFIGSLGINTHVDYTSGPYSNRTITKNSINYLGVKNLRDSPESTRAYTIWPDIARSTGAKFVA